MTGMNAATQPLELHYPVADEDRARADFYAVLARLFYSSPEADFLRSLASADEMVEEGAASGLPAAWNQLCKAAAVCEADAVREEYDALFIGVGKPQVMLFGSYYLAGFMMEKPLAELRSDLAALGLARQSGVAEPEDHISALADVMRHLITDERAAPAARQAAQHRFFSRHIQPWYGKLCAAVEGAPDANFYLPVARFAMAFLDLEVESFQFDRV